MRTTLTIDDDIYRVAKVFAQEKEISIGTVISELARKGLVKVPASRIKNGFHTFSVPPDAKPITLEDVKRAEDDAY